MSPLWPEGVRAAPETEAILQAASGMARSAPEGGEGGGTVTVEHLLLALLDQKEPTLGEWLDARGLRAAEVRTALLKARPPRGGRAADRSGLSLSPAARRAVSEAGRIASARGEDQAVTRADLAGVLLRLGNTALSRLDRTRQDPGAQAPNPRQRSEPGPRRPEPPLRVTVTPGHPAQKRARAPGWWRYPALLALPLSIVLNLLHAPPTAVFIVAAFGVIPLASFMGEATEHIAARTGPALGGLLNATFGNAAELIIAIVALRAGLVELVKASITGSILGNLLLIMGLSFLAGGIGRPVVRFNRTATGMSAGMLALAVAGLVFPALFLATHPTAAAPVVLHFSEAVAVVLALTYGFSLLFSLRTHRSLFSGTAGEGHGPTGNLWGLRFSIIVLALATVGVAVESELLVHSVEAVTATFGVSEMFLGLIVIPIIGNAAEHSTAVVVARKGNMDLSLQIALGSSTQVALLVAPVLVLAGVLLGQDMTLVFTPFEVMAIGLATIAASIITLDGETHWFEGVQLLAVYGVIGVAAWFV